MLKINFLAIVFFPLIFFVACSAYNPKDVIVTAHRGASGYAPENTLAALQKAIDMNAEFAEIDAQETADGKIILLHDGSLSRTAGVEKNIWELNYEDLKQYEVGSWFDEAYRHEKIPLLSEVIDSIRGKLKLNIELKTNGHQKKLAERVVRIVKDMNFQDDCLLTSFDFSEIKKVRKIDKQIKSGYIMKILPEDEDAFKADIYVMSVYRKIVDEGFMKKARENNKEVHVWTVNDEDEMRRLINLGVTSILTNYPDKLNKILNEK